MSTLPTEDLPHVLFMLLLKIVWEQNISITTQNEGAAQVSREATDNEQVINSPGGDFFFNALHLNCRLYKDRVQPCEALMKAGGFQSTAGLQEGIESHLSLTWPPTSAYVRSSLQVHRMTPESWRQWQNANETIACSKTFISSHLLHNAESSFSFHFSHNARCCSPLPAFSAIKANCFCKNRACFFDPHWCLTAFPDQIGGLVWSAAGCLLKLRKNIHK